MGDANERCSTEIYRGGTIYSGAGGSVELPRTRASTMHKKLTPKDRPAKYPALIQHPCGAMGEVTFTACSSNPNSTRRVTMKRELRSLQNHKKCTPDKIRGPRSQYLLRPLRVGEIIARGEKCQSLRPFQILPDIDLSMGEGDPVAFTGGDLPVHPSKAMLYQSGVAQSKSDLLSDEDEAEWNQTVDSLALPNPNSTRRVTMKRVLRPLQNHKKCTPDKIRGPRGQCLLRPLRFGDITAREEKRQSLRLYQIIPDIDLSGLNLKVEDKPTDRNIVSSQWSDVGKPQDLPNKDYCVGSSKEHAGEEWQSMTLKPQKFSVRAPHMDLYEPLRIWEEKVVKVLHMIRREGLTEFNPKIGGRKCTRFCQINIAFFDLDKESEVEHPLFSDIPSSKYHSLDDSVNVISIQIAKSDVPDPLHIYGTVLARDQNDYRCVYLFKRGRDEPQIITGQNRTLALTGPYRALGGRCFTYFEFNLRIKGKGSVDQDFSKGLVVRNVSGDIPHQRKTLLLESYLSTVNLVYAHIPNALEASVRVNLLSGQSDFTGKISAWIFGNYENEIILYDSEVAGTETKLGSGGSVSLSRSILSVPLDEDLVLKFSVYDGIHPKRLELVLVTDVGVLTRMLGPYVLRVNIIWRGVVRQHRRKMWKYIGDTLVLWG